MATFGWTKVGNRRTTAGSMADAPNAIRTVSINSYRSLVSPAVDTLRAEFRYLARKNKISVL